MKRPSRKVLGLIALGLAGLVALRIATSDPLDAPMPFDGAVWRDSKSAEHRPDHPTERQRMLDDVVARVLKGRCEADIVQDLGPSMDSPYFKSTGRDLIYVLGPERGWMAIDSEWLLIWLDDKRCYRRHQIVTD